MADPPGERGFPASPTSSVQRNIKQVKASKKAATSAGSSVQQREDQQAKQSSSTLPLSKPEPAHSVVIPQEPHQPHVPQQAKEQDQRPSNSNKSNRKEMEQKIDKLITRLQRQFSSQRPSEQQTATTQIISFLPRPPDQAASSLGRELADAFLQSLEYSTSDNNTVEFGHFRHKILQSLANRGIHPSIPHAFFAELTSERSLRKAAIAAAAASSSSSSSSNHHYEYLSWEEWLPNYILQREQQIIDELPNSGGGAYEDSEASGLNETLAAALRAYAVSSAAGMQLEGATSSSYNCGGHGAQLSKNNQRRSRSTDEILTTTYRRMQSSAGRTILLREFSRAVKELERIPGHLSPLMASCVLTVWATPHAEKTLLLQELYRLCWDVIYATDSFQNFWDILRWMTEALHIFLVVLPSAGRIAREDRPAWRELAQSWLMEMADMIAFVVHATNSEDNGRVSTERMLAEWLQMVMNKLLPIISTQGAGLYRLSLEPFLEQLNGLIVEMDDSLVQLNTLVVFKLSTMALSTPLKGETKSILTLFSYLLPSESAFARGLTNTVGAIYVQDDSCRVVAKHLLKTAQGMDQQLMGLQDRAQTYHIVQLLEDGEDANEVLKFISGVDAQQLDNLSAVKQIEALLLGVCMIEREDLRVSARTFLINLLKKYPHLGLLLMPSLISDINAAALERSPSELLEKLQFLADSVTVDPSCAQQAWNLLGVQMLEPENPLVLRVTIIRLLPRLCVANKRLYRRVMDTLGAHRNGKTPATNPEALTPDSMHIEAAVLEIRVAVAASIADLAKDDLIRDTSDCIQWIQEFLVEDYSDSTMKALLVHYAVLTLHYLVVAQELDFNLVLKVLKKKLCAVTNIDDVRHLPPVIQEALALLLGDGECNDESSSDEEGEEQKDAAQPPNISAQVVGAVQVLIDLGFRYENVEPDIDTSMELIARIRRNIYYSLSRYSLDALGLDEDGIKAAISWQEEGDQSEHPPSLASRYISLRKLAVSGIQLPASVRGVVPDFDAILEDLNSKVLRFEEAALSAMLWATKGTRHHIVQQRRGDAGKSVSKETASLPAPSKLQSLHKKMPSSPSSIARLLCFEGNFAKFFGLASEVSFDEREPVATIFLIQGFLNSCSRLLGQLYDGPKLKALGSTIEEVRRWGVHTGNGDAMYLTLSALSIYFPLRDEKSEKLILDQIHNETWNAFKNLQFGNNDIAKISLAMTAVSALRSGSHERVTEIIGTLEQTVKGYGGQITFGAAYGLAVIAQAISQIDRVPGGDSRAVKPKMGQIAGFLVGELLACTEETNDRSDVLTTLVACLQSGVALQGLVASLADAVSQQFDLLPARHQTAQYLFIALGLCLPSLSQVNGDLLLGTLFLLERFQWGTGKGTALHPVLLEARTSGVLTDEEYGVIVSEYARIFENGLNGTEKMYGLEDLFYAVNGTSTKPSPHVVRQFLTHTRNRFDDNRCTSPLIGAMASVCSFPCLGFGSKTFWAQVQLRQDIPSSVIDSLLEVISGALDAHTDYSRADYSKNAVMLLGLLASMKNQPNDLSSLPPAPEKIPHSTSSKLKSLKLDFALLPSPRAGTLLSDVMMLIQQAHKGERADSMTRFMRCLEYLSLPGHFAKHFLEPLISEENELTKEACISLLSAQICGRRKAVFDGREFTNMALQICIMPLVSFNSLLGSGKASLKFVTCLEGVVRTLPSELVENGTLNLWEVCLALSHDETPLLVEVLKTFQAVLKLAGKAGKQNNMSPKTKKFLEQFICTRVFADLRELSWGTSMGENTAAEEGSILNSYVTCLTELPLSSLEQFEVFTFQDDDSFSGEVLRALVVLELVKCNYFSEGARAMREISRIAAWFSKKYMTPGAEMYLETMRRMSCALAAATNVLTASEKREFLLSLLEQLLLCQATAAIIGVDLLGIMLASWCGDSATDGDLSMVYCCNVADKLPSLSDPGLSQMFAFYRHDLSANLATYGRREKISAIIANQIWRLYTTFVRHGADEEVLKCLQRSYISGSSGETKEEDFVSLTSSILLEGDNSQSGRSLLL